MMGAANHKLHGGQWSYDGETALQQGATANGQAILGEPTETAALSAGEHNARPGETLTHGGNTTRK
jgi:hypothetical protein